MLKDAPTPAPPLLRRALVESRILAAIPAYNEGATIGSVVLKARQFASEVVVIDDGSTDDTANTAALSGTPRVDSERIHGRQSRPSIPLRLTWARVRKFYGKRTERGFESWRYQSRSTIIPRGRHLVQSIMG